MPVIISGIRISRYRPSPFTLAEGLWNRTSASANSAFLGTNFETQLKAAGVTELALAGVFIDGCVGLTAADAAQRGFDVVFIDDAIGQTRADRRSAILHWLRSEKPRRRFARSRPRLAFPPMPCRDRGLTPHRAVSIRCSMSPMGQPRRFDGTSGTMSPLATQGVSVLPRRNPTTLSRLSEEFQRRKAARRSHG